MSGLTNVRSDLDLAIEAENPLTRDLLINLAEMLDESDFPCQVDILGVNTVSDNLKNIIEKNCVKLHFYS